MENRIEEALNKAKDAVVREAKEALAELLVKAGGEVEVARQRLESMIKVWEESAARLTGLGISSIAEIYLSGGIVHTWHGRSSQYTGSNSPVTRAVESLLSGVWTDTDPRMNIDPKKTYTLFVIIMPEGK